jgi:hypothetical protein
MPNETAVSSELGCGRVGCGSGSTDGGGELGPVGVPEDEHEAESTRARPGRERDLIRNMVDLRHEKAAEAISAKPHSHNHISTLNHHLD